MFAGIWIYVCIGSIKDRVEDIREFMAHRERKRHISPQNLSVRFRQANGPEAVLRALCARLRSARTARLANWLVFPSERSNSLRLPSSFLRPWMQSRQSLRRRNEQRSETPGFFFLAIL